MVYLQKLYDCGSWALEVLNPGFEERKNYLKKHQHLKKLLDCKNIKSGNAYRRSFYLDFGEEILDVEAIEKIHNQTRKICQSALELNRLRLKYSAKYKRCGNWFRFLEKGEK